jgi:hypothetical protein
VPGLKRRAPVSFAIALAALATASDLLLLTARGSHAPAWAHWWCSASGLHPFPQHGEQASGGLVSTPFDSMGALLPHWPHILPIVMALATLIYLWRANARYHACEGQV